MRSSGLFFVFVGILIVSLIFSYNQSNIVEHLSSKFPKKNKTTSKNKPRSYKIVKNDDDYKVYDATDLKNTLYEISIPDTQSIVISDLMLSETDTITQQHTTKRYYTDSENTFEIEINKMHSSIGIITAPAKQKTAKPKTAKLKTPIIVKLDTRCEEAERELYEHVSATDIITLHFQTENDKELATLTTGYDPKTFAPFWTLRIVSSSQLTKPALSFFALYFEIRKRMYSMN